uniref:Fatty acid desaturase n=1 Tax=Eleftheria terrae TaxID=1597781 RepID=A0A0B5H5Y5_9BURK|nr:fatty acid desaturase [Eleftheria terrae]
MPQQRLANVQFDAEIRDELKRLAASDNWHSLAGVSAGYLIVAAAILAGEYSAWLYPLAVLVIGARQRALTTILHDAAHGRAARSRRLNWLVGTYLSGYLVFQTFRLYRQSHVMNHHGHLGEAEHDPDFQLYLDAGLYSGMNRSRFFWRQVVATLLLVNAPAYLWYVTRHRSVALLKSREELLGFTLFWAAVAALLTMFGGWRLFLMYWLVPYMTSFLVIGRFIEIAEHFPMLGTPQARTVLHSTRNRFSHGLEALFFSMHNENYHLVHHLRPEIPYWNLPKAHRAMLRDAEYARVNRQFGGIFFSANRQPALIPALVSGAIALPPARERGSGCQQQERCDRVSASCGPGS